MKKIEATIQVNKIKLIADAITGVVGGFTILEGNGKGSGKDKTLDQKEEQKQLLQNTIKLQ